jgi:hypothetical protein
MVIDYDFRLGRSHLRGKGWRGLMALGLVVMLRAAMVGIVAISAKPFGVYLVQLLRGLLGT